MSVKLLRPTHVAMLTKICDFQHKIGHNLACIRDMTVILAPGRGFRQFKGISQTLLKPTPAAMVTKICKFQYIMGYNSASVRDMTKIPAPSRRV